MALSKKISIATVVGNLKKLLADGVICADGNDQSVMRVIGLAKGTKTGQTDKGEWVALMGTFEALDLVGGEVIQATKCFLPDVVNDLIVAQLNNVLESDPQGSVAFGVEIIVSPDETSVTGYVYKAEFLTNKAADPLEALRGEVDMSVPKLEAPKAAPAKKAAAKAKDAE